MWSIKENGNTILYNGQPIAHFSLALESSIKPRELRKMLKRAMKDLNEHSSCKGKSNANVVSISS